MGRIMGFEPTNAGATIQCLRPLGDIRRMAGVEGFEPSSTVLETAALPLNYTPIKKMVRVTGVEPALVGTRS